MKLRNHPLMTRASGYQNWPPNWTTTRRHPSEKLRGEVGKLEQVLMNDLFPTKVFLIIQHAGFRYMGSMHFDDAAFATAIYHLLRTKSGSSLRDIGNLDLSHLL